MRQARFLFWYYDRVPLVINSGYAQDSRGLFGPSGAEQREVQDGCQNGQPWLDALWPSPTNAAKGPSTLKFDERLFARPIGTNLH